MNSNPFGFPLFSVSFTRLGRLRQWVEEPFWFSAERLLEDFGINTFFAGGPSFYALSPVFWF